jgi:hypothetical protein
LILPKPRAMWRKEKKPREEEGKEGKERNIYPLDIQRLNKGSAKLKLWKTKQRSVFQHKIYN